MRRLTSEAVLIGLLLAFALALGCGKTETYGEAIMETEVTAVSDILGSPAAYDGETVRIEGKIATECPSGCWFELQDDGAIIYVDIAPHGLAIPQKVGSRVVVEGEPLEEGCTVTVLAPERDEAFVLDSQAEASLLAAMAEADRTETLGGDGLLNRLRKRL